MVTNDGNAILRELDIAHPAAKVLVSHSLMLPYSAFLNMSCECTTFWFALNFIGSVSLCFILSEIVGLFGWVQSMIELSRTQDEEVGDGTTSVIILGMLFAYIFMLACMFISDIFLIVDYRYVLYIVGLILKFLIVARLEWFVHLAKIMIENTTNNFPIRWGWLTTLNQCYKVLSCISFKIRPFSYNSLLMVE